MNLGTLITFQFEFTASAYSLDNDRASPLPVLRGVLSASARLLLGQGAVCDLLGHTMLKNRNEDPKPHKNR